MVGRRRAYSDSARRLAAVGGVQIEMLRRISKIYGVPFSENSGKALIAGIAGSMIPASSKRRRRDQPDQGHFPASARRSVLLTMPTLSMGATYAIGMAFIQHFATGGTLLDSIRPITANFSRPRLAKAAPAPRKASKASAYCRAPVLAAFASSHHHSVGNAAMPYFGNACGRPKRFQRAVRTLP